MDQSRNHIPFLQPRLPCAEEYLPYLQEIDRNRWYSNFGALVQQFERECLETFFSGHGSVCTIANCTLGLMLALRNSRPGKYVIMPSFTFAATALSAKWAGLQPFFVDIDPNTWTLDTEQVLEAIDTLGDDVAAVMPYATFGTALDLAFYEDLEQRGIPVIVDAAPGLGAVNPDSTPFGTGFSGTIVFSMHATKPFGIGEGGLIYSGRQETINRLKQLSNFGFSSPGFTEMVGMNAKLPEVAAAIGLAVIKSYPQKLRQLAGLRDAYIAAITAQANLPPALRMQSVRGDVPQQFMPVLLPANADTAGIVSKLLRQGIEARRYFDPPCHRQPVLGDAPHLALDVTNDISARICCLPLWTGMDSGLPQFITDKLIQTIRTGS